MTHSAADPCPCGSHKLFRDCCGPYHAGAAAPDALALMRSRYSAYVLGNRDYLLRTWHASTRPESLDLGLVGAICWLGLTVRQHQVIDADHAQVEFIARSRAGGGPATRLHEISHFVREDERWFYVDGSFPSLAL